MEEKYPGPPRRRRVDDDGGSGVEDLRPSSDLVGYGYGIPAVVPASAPPQPPVGPGSSNPRIRESSSSSNSRLNSDIISTTTTSSSSDESDGTNSRRRKYVNALEILNGIRQRGSLGEWVGWVGCGSRREQPFLFCLTY